MRIALIALGLILVASPGLGAAPDARPRAPRKPAAPTSEQRDADHHFKSGVALFKDGKYSEALAEFERAYEIAPHPLVLYNIAGCHRQLSHYAEAVGYYRRFLADGKGVVAAARLATARTELDSILALVARVTVTIAPPGDGAILVLDGVPLDHPAMPLMVSPGEHQLVARAAGRRDAEQTVHVASGDELAVDLALGEPAPTGAAAADPAGDRSTVVAARPGVAAARPATPARVPVRFAVGAGFGTNLRLVRETGAPSLGASIALGSRIELGLDAVLVAYAVVPSLRIRLVGDALALHAVAAAPYSFSDGASSDRFVAAGLGLGVRYRAMPGLALRLEAYAAFADRMHGTSIPTFLGGELWF
ncbi:MAG TPA: tetratricopeptide repeat protein [Kofleriaceae bacterium]|jgi:hypothetical protein